MVCITKEYYVTVMYSMPHTQHDYNGVKKNCIQRAITVSRRVCMNHSFCIYIRPSKVIRYKNGKAVKTTLSTDSSRNCFAYQKVSFFVFVFTILDYRKL